MDISSPEFHEIIRGTIYVIGSLAVASGVVGSVLSVTYERKLVDRHDPIVESRKRRGDSLDYLVD